MRWMPAFLSLAALAALSGCVAVPAAPPPPPPPLMSPYPASGYGYGYTEERVGPNTMRVVYHGPLRPVSFYGPQRQVLVDRSASEAADLALWRAAQLALAERKPALTIVEQRTDTDTRRLGGWAYDPWWPHYGYPNPYWRHWGYRPWPPAYVAPVADARARATLVVRFENRGTARTVDAAATIRRFEQAYRPPGPPPGPPPSTPPGPPTSPPPAPPRT